MRVRSALAALGLGVGTLVGPASWAQTPLPPKAAAKAPEKRAAKPAPAAITQSQADEMLAELRAIRQLLEKQQPPTEQPSAPAAPTTATLAVRSVDQILGDPNAPITMVEFSDYQCGYCREFHLKVFPELKKNYIDTGKVRFISRDLPLPFHENAQSAAEAARCAGDQKSYWAMRDLLIENAEKLEPADLKAYAEQLRLNKDEFAACLSSGKHTNPVKGDATEAFGMRVDGTPTFLIGNTTKEGVTGRLLVGLMPVAAFRSVIDSVQK